LDAETIAHVGILFEAFTKKYPIAFVCITHSPEIQQMSMWDEVVDL
jgi:ABC-type lipoprotein export system ATPase subunit